MSAEEIVDELEQWIQTASASEYAGRLQQEVERSYGKWQDEQLRIRRQPNAEEPGSDDQEPEEEATWAGTRKGIPLSNGTNARRALRALGIKCRYDVFHDKIEVRERT